MARFNSEEGATAIAWDSQGGFLWAVAEPLAGMVEAEQLCWDVN